jgi:hypothetical protein
MSIIAIAEPTSEACKKSYYILDAAREAAAELLHLFDFPEGRKRGAGNPSNAAQDLLRAMLVFAGAGLDAALKQLIRDAFPSIVESDEAARTKAIDHFSKQLARADGTPAKALARWLFQKKPRAAMIEDLIAELISDSLQSKDQIEKVVDYLKLDRKSVLVDSGEALKAAFVTRNMIIHDLDVDLLKTPKQAQRWRNQRQRASMVEHSNAVLGIAAALLAGVDQKLKE